MGLSAVSQLPLHSDVVMVWGVQGSYYNENKHCQTKSGREEPLAFAGEGFCRALLSVVELVRPQAQQKQPRGCYHCPQHCLWVQDCSVLPKGSVAASSLPSAPTSETPVQLSPFSRSEVPSPPSSYPGAFLVQRLLRLEYELSTAPSVVRLVLQQETEGERGQYTTVHACSRDSREALAA